MSKEEIVDELRKIELEILSLNESNPQYQSLLEDCMNRLNELIKNTSFPNIYLDENGLPKKPKGFSRVHKIPEFFERIGD